MRSKIGKKTIVTFGIILIALGLYNLLYFVIPFNRTLSNSSFWISYGFTTFFFIFSAFLVLLGIKGKIVKSHVFGIPLIKLALVMCVAQLLLDVLLIAIGSWCAVPTWIVIVVESILTAYVLVSVIIRIAYKNYIVEIDSTNKEQFIRELRIELETLNNNYSKHELSKEVNSLYELSKYTDPVSTKEVIDLEDEISNEIGVLKKELELGDINKSKKAISKIDSLLKERKLRIKNNH